MEEHRDEGSFFFPGVESEPDPVDQVVVPRRDSPPDARVTNTWWLWSLYFQPRRFFEQHVIEPMPFLTAICAWVYGMASVIGRIESQHMQGRLSADPMGMTTRWDRYMAVVACLGAAGGLAHYWIGGWWYRRRVVWSGVQDPDAGLARRVYLYASQVVVIPVLLVTLGRATVYHTPVDMIDSDNPWVVAIAGVVAVLTLWSVWVSYCGVKTVFDPQRRGRARLWFLVLPGLVYTAVFALVVVAGAMTVPARTTDPPDLDHPKAFRSSTVRFGYPGNWSVRPGKADKHQIFSLRAAGDQDSVLAIRIFESQSLPEEELAMAVAGLRNHFDDWREEYLSPRWGAMKGVGIKAVGDIDQEPYRLSVLVVRLATGRYMEIRQVCLVADESEAQPAFDLIQRSFKISRRLIQ